MNCHRGQTSCGQTLGESGGQRRGRRLCQERSEGEAVVAGKSAGWKSGGVFLAELMQVEERVSSPSREGRVHVQGRVHVPSS